MDILHSLLKEHIVTLTATGALTIVRVTFQVDHTVGTVTSVGAITTFFGLRDF